MSLADTIKADIQILEQDFATFLTKVKTGVQVLQADLDAAVKAITANIGVIDAAVKDVITWLPAILNTLDANNSQRAVVNLAIADAQKLLIGLNAVASTSAAGSTDVQAVVNGIVAVKQAQATAANLVATAALIQTPVQTQIVSPPTPPAA